MRELRRERETGSTKLEGTHASGISFPANPNKVVRRGRTAPAAATPPAPFARSQQAYIAEALTEADRAQRRERVFLANHGGNGTNDTFGDGGEAIDNQELVEILGREWQEAGAVEQGRRDAGHDGGYSIREKRGGTREERDSEKQAQRPTGTSKSKPPMKSMKSRQPTGYSEKTGIGGGGRTSNSFSLFPIKNKNILVLTGASGRNRVR